MWKRAYPPSCQKRTAIAEEFLAKGDKLKLRTLTIPRRQIIVTNYHLSHYHDQERAQTHSSVTWTAV